MTVRRGKSARARAKSPVLVLGAVIGTISYPQAADHRQAALPAERRVYHHLPRRCAEL